LVIREEQRRWRVKRGGLGRGLSSLIPGAAEEAGLLEVPVSAIQPNPRQPRVDFPEESLAALARSIREVGVLQPVVVRRRDSGYELVAGERRVRAAKLAGLATIPAIVREGDDTESLREALIENIHREDLAALELASAFQELLEELGVTQETVAERLGYSRAHIACSAFWPKEGSRQATPVPSSGCPTMRRSRPSPCAWPPRVCRFVRSRTSFGATPRPPRR